MTSRLKRSRSSRQPAGAAPQAWLASIYAPHHQLLAIAPVAVATALAARTASAEPVVAALCCAAAAGHESGGRLINYRQDLDSGVDDPSLLPERHPLRTGRPSATAMWRAGVVTLVIVGVICAILMARVSSGFALLAPLFIAGTFAYAGGPTRYGHRTLGEVGRFLALGTMLWGSFWVQTETVTTGSLVAATAFGMLAVGGMTVQNHRDREADARAGKVTLAVRLGKRGTDRLLWVLLLVPYGLLVPLARLEDTWWALLPMATLPWAIWLARRVARDPATDFFLHPRRTIPGMVAYGLLLTVGLAPR